MRLKHLSEKSLDKLVKKFAILCKKKGIVERHSVIGFCEQNTIIYQKNKLRIVLFETIQGKPFNVFTINVFFDKHPVLRTHARGTIYNFSRSNSFYVGGEWEDV